MTDVWESCGDDPDRVVPSAEAPEGAAECASRAGGYECTRSAGHKGRHLAGIGEDHIVAAWPGRGRPTEADLTAVPS